MSKYNKTLKEFEKQKNKKILFTPGPASLLKENITGLEPCFGRGDLKYDQIEADISFENFFAMFAKL